MFDIHSDFDSAPAGADLLAEIGLSRDVIRQILDRHAPFDPRGDEQE